MLCLTVLARNLKYTQIHRARSTVLIWKHDSATSQLWHAPSVLSESLERLTLPERPPLALPVFPGKMSSSKTLTDSSRTEPNSLVTSHTQTVFLFQMEFSTMISDSPWIRMSFHLIWFSVDCLEIHHLQ